MKKYKNNNNKLFPDVYTFACLFLIVKRVV